MNYKILEQNGVTNENVDGAAFNLFCSGRKDGILEGVLNECRLISTSSNIIGIDTGVFLVQGFRVKIFEAMYWSMVASDTPGAYHLIFSLTVNKDRSVVGEFSVEKDNYLTKDQIPLNEQGLYQIQILRFDWDGEAISNLSKIMPVISTQEAAVENVPAKIQASMSEDERYILKLSLTNKDGEEIAGSSSEIDLPLEMAFVGAEAVEDEDGNEFVEFTLQNGEKLRVGLSEIFKGKVDKTTEAWKLYGTGSGGRQYTYSVSTNGKNSAIAQYYKLEETSMNPDAGYLNTPDPKYDFNCVNKRTMDDKVDPIASDVAIIFDALGGAIEYASIDSTTNPVTVPSNVFPAATIDKIGTGIALAGTSILDQLENVDGDVTADINIETVSITGDTTDVVEIVASLTEELHIGDEYSFCVSVVGGSYDSAEALNVADSYTLTTLGTRVFTTSQENTTKITFVLGIDVESVHYDNLVLKFDIDINAHVEGVPVASVKKGAETIYTVPEAIRALTYPILDLSGGVPANVYGLALSDTVYNYLDLENKTYVLKCCIGLDENASEVVVPFNHTIDVSAYLTDEDGEITVAAGDEILFVDADGNSAGSTVPSTITYIVKKGALE